MSKRGTIKKAPFFCIVETKVIYPEPMNGSGNAHK
jgi:hypothetical protein